MCPPDPQDLLVCPGGIAIPMPSCPPPDLDGIDDDEEGHGGGMKLNTATRLSLMSKLAGGAAGAVKLVQAAATVDLAVALQQGKLGPASPIPTQYVLIKVTV